MLMIFFITNSPFPKDLVQIHFIIHQAPYVCTARSATGGEAEGGISIIALSVTGLLDGGPGVIKGPFDHEPIRRQ